MDKRLQLIQEHRKLQGVKWKDLAENLPISAEGLRIAFTRDSVDPTYLKVIEEKLGITKPTEQQKEETPAFDPRFEDLIALKLIDYLKPFLDEFQENHKNIELDSQEKDKKLHAIERLLKIISIRVDELQDQVAVIDSKATATHDRVREMHEVKGE